MVNRPVSGWYLPMNEVQSMTPEQLTQGRRLIPQKCCNYDKGHCLALDGDEPCQCVQMWSYSLICKWFHFAVLPNNWELCAQIHNNLPQKRCARKAGDKTYIASTSTSTDDDGNETTTVNGYYVVYFDSVTDNKQNTRGRNNVRL